MTTTPHNRLWERLLAALADRNALPADSGNCTPLEIARFADERLRTNLAVPFVEGFYLERRYGGKTSKQSEAEAEALVAQIESTPRLAAFQSAPSTGGVAQNASTALQTPASQALPENAPKSAVARPGIEESQPIGVELLPKPKPAPKPTPPTPPTAPVVEQVAASAVAAKPKPKKPAKPKKIRRTFGQWMHDLVKGFLPKVAFFAICLALVSPLLYWDHWRHTSHWKLATDGDSTYITAMSDIYGSTQKDPSRERLMIGCENGQDFIRFNFDSPMPASEKPYIYQGVYLHHSLRIPSPDDPHITTLVSQDTLILKPTEGETSSSDFQVASLLPEDESDTQSARKLKGKELNVPDFVSAFSRSGELVLRIDGYVDSQGKHWEYNGGSFDYGGNSVMDKHFGIDGLAKYLPELEQACHWNPPQP